MSQTIGFLDVKGWIPAIEALDAMLKSATVSCLGHRASPDGLLFAITGDYKSVLASLEVGIRIAQSFDVQVTKHVIALPHADTKKMLEALLTSNTSLD